MRPGWGAISIIALLRKYATAPTQALKEYAFTSNEANLAELATLKAHHARVFIVLVYRTAKEICVLTQAEFEAHRAPRESQRRRRAALPVTGDRSRREEFPGVHERAGVEEKRR